MGQAMVRLALIALLGLLAGSAAADTTVGNITFSDGLTVTADGKVKAVVLRNYISGLTLANNAGTPNTKIDIAAGQAANSTNALLLSSTGTLTIDATTIGANGMDAGALGASTWYHVHLIAQAGGVTAAGLLSTSVASPTLPATYVYSRRIGSVLTNASSQLVAFKQIGRHFYWLTSVRDLNAGTVTTTPSLQVLTVPTGIQVRPLTRIGTTAGSVTMVSGTDITQTPGATFATAPGFSMGASSIIAGAFPNIFTNTSGQIRIVSQGSSTVTVYSDGWIDDAGAN